MSVDQIDFGQAHLNAAGPDFVTIENLTVRTRRDLAVRPYGIVLRNMNGKTFDIFGGVGNIRVLRGQLRAVRGDGVGTAPTG